MSMTNEHDVITAQRGHVQALAFARKGGVALSSLLGNIATAKETERKGPLWGFVFLTDTFTDDELDAIPVIGSRMGQTGNKPYDRYTVPAKGDIKAIQGSWLTDATRATADYVATQQRIEWCDDVTIADCPADIRDMGSVSRAQEKERLSQRKKDLRTALSNTVGLFHHFRVINSLNPATIKVRLPLREEHVLDADGKVTDETKTVVYSNIIRIEDPSKVKEDILLNVNQFLALKPEALKPGEPVDITHLELTGKRAPKGNKTKGKGKADIAPPNTVELFLNFCNIGGTAINPDEANGARLNAAILEAASGKGDKADDTVETIGDFAMRIDAIWTVISARYMLIKQQKLAKRNVEAQSQAASEAAARRAGATG